MRKSRIFFAAALIASCASMLQAKPKPNVSEYLNNPAYIAYRGYGTSRESAESSALSQISKYFSMNVHVTTAERALVTTDGASSSEITEETFVESQTELFAVHYTVPVFDKKRKTYEVIAYIDRAEAWGMYEPKVKQCVSEYSAWVKRAQEESSMFLRALRCWQALSCAERNSLEPTLQFATMLYPDGAAWYESIWNELGALPTVAAQYASQCPVLIESENVIVKDAVAATLGKARFIVTDDMAATVVQCAVTVTENQQELVAGTFYTPSVLLVFSELRKDGGKPLFSYEANLERTGAKNPQVAEQRAYAKVAKHIQDELLSALNAAK